MNIVEDIVDEILSRLPVKSLLRFQVVCKDWHLHIHSDYFIAKHIKNQKTNEKMLIYHNLRDRLRFAVTICSEIEIKEEEDDDDDSQTMFHLDQQYYLIDDTLDYLRNCEDNNEDVKNFLKSYSCHQLSETNYMDWFCVDLVGSCNGLVCLDYQIWNDDGGHYDEDEEEEEEEDYEDTYDRIITLWNPATRDFKVLPSCDMRPLDDAVDVIDNIGFGFDSTSNDYKVLFLRIHGFWGYERINHAMMYSLNTNSWRELDYSNVREITFRGCDDNTISFRENVYWVKVLFDMLQNPVLLSFDMVKEVFQSTLLPSCVKSDSSTYILTLHESIALVVVGTSDKTLQIWTTKELEQGRESWTKVFNVNLSCVNCPTFGFWKNKNSEDFLFLFDECIDGRKVKNVIYINNRGDIKNLNDQGEIKDLNMMTMSNITQPLNVVTYVETLISVNRL